MKILLKTKAAFMIYLIIFISIITSNALAQEKVCCEKTKDNNYCIYTNKDKCDTSFRSINLEAPCEQTQYCQIGCCISKTGICYKSTSSSTCKAIGGEWLPDSACQDTSCYKGCCKLTEKDCKYQTESACSDDFSILYPEKETLFYTLTTQDPERECQSLCEEQKQGCCVEYDTCTYTKREQCNTAGLELQENSENGFFTEQYCSSLEQCSECLPQYTKKCSGPDNEDVYWFDSCGNQEDLAEDCDFNTKDNLCVEEQETYCKSMNCETTYDADNVPYDGILRKNGESWCQYDGKPGASADLVGSRHYRHLCINGEELVEPCRDFREEYCFHVLATNVTKGDYYYGKCTPNRWKDCSTTCNSAADASSDSQLKEAMKEDKECCRNSELRDCIWLGDDESGQCISLVVPGFAHYGSSELEESIGSSRSSGLGTCKVGDKQCRVYWAKKNVFDDWDLVGNEECLEQDFADSSNSYCRSLGDCGNHYNFIGTLTEEGYSCSTDSGDCQGKKHDNRYNLEKPNPGSWAEWRDVGEGLLLGNIDLSSPDVDDTFTSVSMIVSATLGGIGGALALTGAILSSNLVFGSVGTATYVLSNIGLGFLAPLLFNPFVLIGFAVVAAILIILSTTADQDKLDINIKCLPWQAPAGGEHCHECPKEFKTCSEYRCRSLGLTCRLVNEGTPEAQCIDAYPNDANSPTIKPDYNALSKDYFYKDVTSAGFEITPEIKLYDRLQFGIITSEEAQCKIHNNHTKTYEEMPSLYLDKSYFRKQHNTTLAILDPGKEYTYYIRCIDYAGNYNSKEYTIKYKASEAPDLTPPIIEFTNPANQALLPNNINQTILTLYLNEPANCRYSEEDQTYENLQNNFTCFTHSTNFDQYFECQEIINITNNYFIRCQDLNNNTNQESYKLTFYKTKALNITSTQPSGILYNKDDAILTIITTAGSSQGKATCYFSYESNIKAEMTKFLNTDSSSHTQPLDNLNQGSHKINILCEDSAKNQAKTKTTFTLDIDDQPPTLLMLYQDNKNIYLTLNEPSTCEYSNIPFEFGESTTTTFLQTQHTIPLSKEFYYVICEDQYNNELPMIVIYPYKERIYHELNEQEIEQALRNQSILYI